MSLTPVMFLGIKHPAYRKDIEESSKKWKKRTKGLDSCWPEGGTFDVNVCKAMELQIKDYKPKDKSKKRQQKREKELGIVKLFHDEGNQYRKKLRESRVVKQSNTKDKTYDKSNHVTKETGIYPIISGAVDISGTVEINDALEASHMPIPKSCSTLKKNLNFRKSQMLDCYAERNQPCKEGGESYWLDSGRAEPGREMERTRIQELEEEIDSNYNSCLGGGSGETDVHELGERLVFEEQAGPSRERQEVDVLGGKLTFAAKERDAVRPNIEKGNYDLRLRPAIRPPERYTDPGQYTNSIKGKQSRYIPWQTLDFAGLISRLPGMHEGASKWIKVFEEETMDKILAIGDIKAVWARTMGIPAMENTLRLNGNAWMIDPNSDGTEFNPYRTALWSSLRREYPIQIDPKALKGEPLTDTENPAAYISRQLKRWKQETEEDPGNSALLTTIFRNSIIDAMPSPVKSRLEDVVGLVSKTHREFCDHVIHAVDRHRTEEQKLREQERAVQRKVSQLQLTDLTNKSKKKVQAPVFNDDEEAQSGAIVAPAVAVPSAPPFHYQFPAPPPQAPPVVNVYTQQPRGKGKKATAQKGNQVGQHKRCWGCNQPGHNRRDCPKNPWPTQQEEGPGSEGQPTQSGNAGPANPGGGPKHGY
ncbi:hypothetical protein D5F01_LYC11278 [Larimichthys crocea]|uniref:CCHC-type domain-containing protein n=1 Tax=Larimichthys crocea TaxID=215358 RepID=A0A6G0IDV8_LARCR|nr:hypothetical protein D5F01_LYC11278 [Larimichthys crocea]